MKARQILNYRRLIALLPKVLEGARVVVVRPFPGMPEGVAIGDDVTEAVTGLPTFQSMLKRGYLRVKVDPAVKATIAPLRAVTSAPSSKTAAPSDRLGSLRALTATASKKELRAVLEDLGHTPALDASREDMFKARTRLLAAAVGASAIAADNPAPDVTTSTEAADIDIVDRDADDEAA